MQDVLQGFHAQTCCYNTHALQVMPLSSGLQVNHFFTPKKIFDKLEDIGVFVAQEKRYYPCRTTYDIKTYTDAEGGPRRYTTMFL